jgi:ABC-type glycerol-3-phosphate transport system permease component
MIQAKTTPSFLSASENKSVRKGGRFTAGQLLIYVFLTIGILYTLIPFLWMLGTSFKSGTEIVRMPPTLIPEKFTLASYMTIFTDPRVPLGKFYLNSITVTFSIVIMFSGWFCIRQV